MARPKKAAPKFVDLAPAYVRQRSAAVDRALERRKEAGAQYERTGGKVKAAAEDLRRAENRHSVAQSAGTEASIPIAAAEVTACRNALDAALHEHRQAEVALTATKRALQQAEAADREDVKERVRSELAPLVEQYNEQAALLAETMRDIQGLIAIGQSVDAMFATYGSALPTLPKLFASHAEAVDAIRDGGLYHFQGQPVMTVAAHAHIMQHHLNAA